MNSIAAYYVLVAMNTEDANRRRTFAPAKPPRPSLLARVRAIVAPRRSVQPAGTSA
jgi:hypothetical protein